MTKKKRYIVKRTGKDITDLIEMDVLVSLASADEVIKGRGIFYKNGVTHILQSPDIVMENADAVVLDVDEADINLIGNNHEA
jgi:hypothetical protein